MSRLVQVSQLICSHLLVGGKAQFPRSSLLEVTAIGRTRMEKYRSHWLGHDDCLMMYPLVVAGLARWSGCCEKICFEDWFEGRT